MIKQEQRAVATWQEAVNMLASNGNTMVDAFNDLEKKVNRKSRAAGLGFLCMAAACFILKTDRDDLHKRLDKCEKALQEKRDRVFYTDDGK